MSMTLVAVKMSLIELSAALISQAMRNRTDRDDGEHGVHPLRIGGTGPVPCHAYTPDRLRDTRGRHHALRTVEGTGTVRGTPRPGAVRPAPAPPNTHARPSTAPDDGTGTLFGLDALTPGPPDAAPAAGPLFRDSATARRLLPVREIHAEPAAAASPRGRQVIARFPRPVWSGGPPLARPRAARQRGQRGALGAGSR